MLTAIRSAIITPTVFLEIYLFLNICNFSEKLKDGSCVICVSWGSIIYWVGPVAGLKGPASSFGSPAD